MYKSVDVANKNHQLSVMATQIDDSPSGGFRYLIVKPENGGITDLVRGLVRVHDATALNFMESSDMGLMEALAVDHRWVIFVSVIARKIIAFFGKPLEWTGCSVEFLLNLLSHNGSLPTLLYNLFHGKVVIPQRGSETFISAIGHLDGRIDLYHPDHLVKEVSDSASMGQAIMDLCIMAAKLAYENANVVRNIVVHHWKMHFVDFYNGWNEFQKQYSTQVFILCDQRKDANLIMISFRGTEPFDADDWSTDFDYGWYEIPKLGKVHMGFLEALGLGDRSNAATFQAHLDRFNEGLPCIAKEKLPPGLMLERTTAYSSVRNKLKTLLVEHKNAKFIVTGHSLGGALAVLFPTVLLLHEEKEVMQRLLGIYTFGQPRVGNQQLRKFMEAHLEHPIPKYFRVVYCNDLVPRLPYDDNTFLYKHFGVCLYYDSCYIGLKVDEEPNRNYFGMRYLIPEYVNAVWELMRSLTMGYKEGPEYKEGWLSIFLRVIGLALPGVSAHSPTNYVDSVRLGKAYTSEMPF